MQPWAFAHERHAGGGPLRVLDSADSSLYNAPRFAERPTLGRPGAQVAQLVEHVTENHGVRGSIPRLGTNKNSHLAKLDLRQ